MGLRLLAATVLGAAALGIGAACGPAGALHLTVNTSADGRDAAIGDRICEATVGTGDCTLRAAIDETNVLPFTTDRIEIAPGIDPTLAIAGADEDANATGDLDVVGNMTIEGGGATINGALLDRVFDHRGAGLTLKDLIVTGGGQSGGGDPPQLPVPPGQPFELGNGGFGSGAGIRSVGPLTLTDTTVSGNRMLYLSPLELGDPRGAGVAAFGGPVHLTRTLIRGNTIEAGTGGRGAGLAVQGVDDLSIVGSTVRDNAIHGRPAADTAFGAGIALDATVARIERSTIAANSAVVASGSGNGAGISAAGTDLTIVRSTMSGNDAGTAFAPVDAISSVGGSLDIVASTIVTSGPETAVAAQAGAVATITASVLTAPCTGTVTSGGWNAGTPDDPLGTVDGCGLTQPTDLVGADLRLGPLALNGGPTATHLPQPGSPLIDRIPAATPGACAPPGQDQRGVPAPRGGGCDVGSVEVQPAVVPPGTPLALVVDSPADVHDVDPGDGVCTTPTDGCTLRAAIDEANRWDSTGDTITIAAGVDPVIGIAGATDDENGSGDLDVWGTLAICGGGATVDGARLDRVIDHHSGSLAIDHLTITGGEQSGVGLEVDGVIVVAGNGGPGPGGGIRSSAPLTLADSVVTGNQVLYLTHPFEQSRGGGVAVSGGPFHLVRSTVRDNRIQGRFGGRGAGLIASGVAEVSIIDSVIAGNVGYGDGNSIEATGGGIALERSVATIDRSTISANLTRAKSNVGMGGGIYAEATDLVITRSTLSGNITEGAGWSEIFAQGGTLTVDSSTIVGGPAFRAVLATNGTLRSSVLTTACDGAFVSAGWNVTTDPAGCGVVRSTDLAGVDVLLGPLADNGGPTPTHLPAPGSPVVDRIPLGTAAVCAVAGTDQRGEPVPAGPGCDVGAVEVQPSDR